PRAPPPLRRRRERVRLGRPPLPPVVGRPFEDAGFRLLDARLALGGERPGGEGARRLRRARARDPPPSRARFRRAHAGRGDRVHRADRRSGLPRSPSEARLNASYQLEGVAAGYGRGRDVLADLTLSIPSGRSVALLGENGSGKSTLLKVLAGLLPTRRGSLRF